MKITHTLIGAAMVGFIVQAGAVELNNNAQKASYAIGVDLGQSIRKVDPNGDIDLAALIEGFKQSYNGVKPAITSAEMKVAVEDFAKQRIQKINAAMEKAGKENAAAGKAFLTANKTKDGVKTTASGLQYQVLQQGSGAHPQKGDSVTVNYEGRLLDGTVFDSSYQHKKPVTFRLNEVIPGWTEGLQLMNKGAKYTFYVPAELAYGSQGAGAIGPNATLVFDVELLGINHDTKSDGKTK